MLNLTELRKDYNKETIDVNTFNANPMYQFNTWFQQAIDVEIDEPNAMVLSTVNSLGKPSSRVVLLKHTEAEGFIFFTNYLSRKGQDIEKNTSVSLLFFWKELERQVRIEGHVEKKSPELASEYFKSRPYKSQIAAVISPQSQEIPNRAFLDQKMSEMENQIEPITCPEHWGGYIIKPEYMEFWQGRANRLHDRIAYIKNSDLSWRITRLAP